MLLVLSIMSSAFAEGWSGEGELGFTSTSGNTNAESLNAKLGLGKKHGKWSHAVLLTSLQSSNNGLDSADRVVFTGKSEYNFLEKTFLFGRVRYEKDKFSGFDHQTVISFGIGHVILDTDKHTLEGSAGIGYSDIEDDFGAVSNNVIFDGELKYAYKISETAKFIQNLRVEAGKDNTYSKSETFLQLKVVGNLSAKLGYEVQRNSNAPVGAEEIDRVTTITLVYAF